MAQARRRPAGSGARLITVALASLLAAGPISGQYLEILGWTRDGSAFVWKQGVALVASDCEGPDCSGADQYVSAISTTAVVRSALTGEEQRFDLESIPQRGKEKPTRLGGFEAFQAWKKAHPLVKLERLAGSTAGVTVKGEEQAVFGDEEVDAVFYTTRHGAKVTLQRPMGGAGALVSRDTSVREWFDPTGRRVLFELSQPSAMTSRGELAAWSELVVMAAGPTVAVLSTDDQASTRDEVAGKVEAAGFAVVTKGGALKPRKSTVIYFAPAQKKTAEKLASVLGAAIEPLTWKPNEHLVVAVGE